MNAKDNPALEGQKGDHRMMLVAEQGCICSLSESLLCSRQFQGECRWITSRLCLSWILYFGESYFSADEHFSFEGKITTLFSGHKISNLVKIHGCHKFM